MNEQGGIPALIQKVHSVPDEKALSTALASMQPANICKPLRICFVNAHAINLCSRDSGFLAHLLEADYVFRDGSGMKILLKLLRANPGMNMNGTDLIPRIIKLYTGCDAALLGTQEPYLGRAVNVIKENGLNPVLKMDGFQEEVAYLQAAQKHPASLIVLAMGMPRQERVAALLADNLDYPCLIICGGAILDFMGGKVTRAPLIFRRLGIEWLYRLAQEPRRLFKRYVIGNFIFLFRCLRLSLQTGRLP